MEPWRVLLFHAILVVSWLDSSSTFLLSTLPTKHHYWRKEGESPSATSLHATSNTIAILGGDLAGVIAACVIASSSSPLLKSSKVCLLTGESQILAHMPNPDLVPILPDVTLENRQLIDSYGRGGRELAGLLAKQCSPLQAQQWLETNCGIQLQNGASDDMSVLLQEKPVFVNSKFSLAEVLQNQLEASHVDIQTNVQISGISSTNTNDKFQINCDNMSNALVADIVILSGDYRDVPSTPILSSKQPSFFNKKPTFSGKPTTNNNSNKPNLDHLLAMLDEVDDVDEPMSLKDQMQQRKRKQQQEKQQKLDALVNADSVNVKELTKQELRVLQKKKKKEAKKQKQQQQDSRKVTYQSKTTNDNNEDDAKEDKDTTASDTTILASTKFNTSFLAQSLGHAVADEVFGLFTFMTSTSGSLLDGCSKSIVPKARIRCKVEMPGKKGSSMPKWEGPLFLAQGEVSGPAALRLSSLICTDMAKAGYRASLQIHFAPDIGGVNDLENMLLQSADPNALVLKSPCPLVHREIDYDDYTIETGDFQSVEFPLVPDRIWRNLCQQAGITSSKLRWKDLPPGSLQSIACLMVDCSLEITGVRPLENVRAGGVSLKEINMSNCQSLIHQNLFICGSAMDVHGFDGGFNSLASFATGYVAGTSAVELARELPLKVPAE